MIAVVYNKNDYKLSAKSYSKNYADMFNALAKDALHITESCSAQDIDADAIIFFDPHSSHDIKIDGIERHRAVKYEYFNDPHQVEQTGFYTTGEKFHKLGAEQRCKRTIERGVTKVICPAKDGFNKYLVKYLPEDSLLWFPVVPKKPDIKLKSMSERYRKVIGNGHLWQGTNDFKPYEFRAWAYLRESVTYVPHYAGNKNVPIRDDYMVMLSLFAGGLALCDVYPVAKYFEIPLCGCLVFMQYLPECDDLGFKNWENCIYVNKDNFDVLIKEFRHNVNQFQHIADAGRSLCEQRWTADKFAEFIYDQI